MAIETNCQTAAEIRRHVESDLASDEFCLHSVSDPTSSLVSDSPISPDLQLAPNLEVAFLNSQKAFEEARPACASLGSGWHRPASRHQEADPRAVDNSDQPLWRDHLSKLNSVEKHSGLKFHFLADAHGMMAAEVDHLISE